MASVTSTCNASLGPRFVAVIVYVSSWPATTGLGEAVLVTLRLALTTTRVAADAELFDVSGSPEPIALTTAVLVIVPPGALALTLTVSVMVAMLPTACRLVRHTTVPVVPTVGLTGQLQPTKKYTSKNDVTVGMASVT